VEDRRVGQRTVRPLAVAAAVVAQAGHARLRDQRRHVQKDLPEFTFTFGSIPRGSFSALSPSLQLGSYSLPHFLALPAWVSLFFQTCKRKNKREANLQWVLLAAVLDNPGVHGFSFGAANQSPAAFRSLFGNAKRKRVDPSLPVFQSLSPSPDRCVFIISRHCTRKILDEFMTLINPSPLTSKHSSPTHRF